MLNTDFSILVKSSLIIIALGLIMLSIYYLYLQTKRKKTNSVGMNDQIAQKTDLQQSQAENKLHFNFTDALAALQATELVQQYGYKEFMYALPWILVLGANSTGKTSLLRHSRLHFSLSKLNSVLNAENNIHCEATETINWWFADKAIFIDSAGKYVSDEQSHNEWLLLLDLLNKYRHRKPLDGILLTIDLNDILETDLSSLMQKVKIIRDRIAEIYYKLGYCFPIYLIMTKSDLLPGFNEFFEHLNTAEVKQCFGIDLSCVQHEQKVQVLKQGFLELYQNLQNSRIQKISLTPNLMKKISIFTFPDIFKKTNDKLQEFLQALFKDNPYQETPHFQGLYFTSATSGFFINEMMHQIMGHGSFLIKKNRQSKSVARWQKRGALILSIIGVIGATAWCHAALARNTLLLQKSLQLLSDYQRISQIAVEEHSLGNTNLKFVQLNNLIQYYQRLLLSDGDVPFYLRLGLYHCNILTPTINSIIHHELEEIFYQSLGSFTELQLQVDAKNWQESTMQQKQQIRGAYYSLLKLYLMLCYPAHQDISFMLAQIPLLQNDLSRQYDQQLTNNIAMISLQNTELLKYYLTYIAKTIMWPANVKIVNVARAQLYSSSAINNLYAQLINNGLTQFGTTHLHELIQVDGAELLQSNYSLPIIYTSNGWKKYIAPTIQQLAHSANNKDWVMDIPLASDQAQLFMQNQPASTAHSLNESYVQQITAELQQRYFMDYEQNWINFLYSIHLSAMRNLTDVSQALPILANIHGPMMALMQTIALNQINCTNVGNNAETNCIKISNQNIKPLQTIQDIFQPQFSQATQQTMQQYLQQLQALQNEIEPLSISPNIGFDAITYARQILSGQNHHSALYMSSVICDLMLKNNQNEAEKNVFSYVLFLPVRATWSVILNTAAQSLNQVWQAQVYNDFQEQLAQQMPFHHSGDAADLNGITHFFQPQDGIFWKFINQQLGAFLMATPSGWQSQTWLNKGFNFMPAFLQTLTKTQQITSELFKHNDNNIGFSIAFYPVPSPAFDEIKIISNGEGYRYRNEPQEWQSINWPGNVQNSGSSLEIIVAHDHSQAEIQYNGLWGIFSLFRRATIAHEAGNVYRATWILAADDGQKYPVSVLFRMAGDGNLITDLLVNTFLLPEKIIQTMSQSPKQTPLKIAQFVHIYIS